MNRLALLVAFALLSSVSHSPAQAVDHTKLIALLPPAPEGWIADKPEGSTSGTGAEMISAAGRSYTKGTGDDVPTASINLIDSGTNKAYRETVTAGWTRAEQTEEGYGKAISVNGSPGFEHFEKEIKTGIAWLQVASRYFVQVELVNVEPAELQTWLKLVDVKALAGVK